MTEYTEKEIEEVSLQFEEAEKEETNKTYFEIVVSCGGSTQRYSQVSNLKVNGKLIEFDFVGSKYENYTILDVIKHVKCIGLLIMTVE